MISGPKWFAQGKRGKKHSQQSRAAQDLQLELMRNIFLGMTGQQSSKRSPKKNNWKNGSKWNGTDSKPKWVCSTCSFDNYDWRQDCWKCQQNLPEANIPSTKQGHDLITKVKEVGLGERPTVKIQKSADKQKQLEEVLSAIKEKGISGPSLTAVEEEIKHLTKAQTSAPLVIQVEKMRKCVERGQQTLELVRKAHAERQKNRSYDHRTERKISENMRTRTCRKSLRAGQVARGSEASAATGGYSVGFDVKCERSRAKSRTPGHRTRKARINVCWRIQGNHRWHRICGNTGQTWRARRGPQRRRLIQVPRYGTENKHDPASSERCARAQTSKPYLAHAGGHPGKDAELSQPRTHVAERYVERKRDGRTTSGQKKQDGQRGMGRLVSVPMQHLFPERYSHHRKRRLAQLVSFEMAMFLAIATGPLGIGGLDNHLMACALHTTSLPKMSDVPCLSGNHAKSADPVACPTTGQSLAPWPLSVHSGGQTNYYAGEVNPHWLQEHMIRSHLVTNGESYLMSVSVNHQQTSFHADPDSRTTMRNLFVNLQRVQECVAVVGSHSGSSRRQCCLLDMKTHRMQSVCECKLATQLSGYACRWASCQQFKTSNGTMPTRHSWRDNESMAHELYSHNISVYGIAWGRDRYYSPVTTECCDSISFSGTRVPYESFRFTVNGIDVQAVFTLPHRHNSYPSPSCSHVTIEPCPPHGRNRSHLPLLVYVKVWEANCSASSAKSYVTHIMLVNRTLPLSVKNTSSTSSAIGWKNCCSVSSLTWTHASRLSHTMMKKTSGIMISHSRNNKPVWMLWSSSKQSCKKGMCPSTLFSRVWYRHQVSHPLPALHRQVLLLARGLAPNATLSMMGTPSSARNVGPVSRGAADREDQKVRVNQHLVNRHQHHRLHVIKGRQQTSPCQSRPAHQGKGRRRMTQWHLQLRDRDPHPDTLYVMTRPPRDSGAPEHKAIAWPSSPKKEPWSL